LCRGKGGGLPKKPLLVKLGEEGHSLLEWKEVAQKISSQFVEKKEKDYLRSNKERKLP